MTSRFMTLTALGITIIGAILVSCDKTDPTATTDSTLTVTANPSTLSFVPPRTTATTRIDALVLDTTGQPLDRVAVRFSTDAGTLASNGRPVTANSDGIASDTLTVGVNDADPTVTARSGNKTGEVTVTRAGENRKPVAVIKFSPTAISYKTGADVTFDARGSTDADGNDTITAWSWTFPADFQGHTADTRQLFTTHFSAVQSATDNVTLVVTDDQGLASVLKSATLVIVEHFPPTASINALGSSPQVNVSFTVTGSGTADTGHTIASYTWNMGDATADFTTQTASTSYTYSTTGNKTITLKVNDNGDGTACSPTTPFTCHLSLTSTAATLNVTVVN